jgi:hypothetical protein
MSGRFVSTELTQNGQPDLILIKNIRFVGMVPLHSSAVNLIVSETQRCVRNRSFQNRF